jgi:hypothetical protein
VEEVRPLFDASGSGSIQLDHVVIWSKAWRPQVDARDDAGRQAIGMAGRRD